MGAFSLGFNKSSKRPRFLAYEFPFSREFRNSRQGGYVSMMVQETKTKLRRDAFARRKAAHRLGDDGSAGQNVIRFVADHAEMRVIAGYMPIQTEIDPRPAMQELHALGHKLCLPVITGRDQPLIFREWHPDAQLIEGEFGAKIPALPLRPKSCGIFHASAPMSRLTGL